MLRADRADLGLRKLRASKSHARAAVTEATNREHRSIVANRIASKTKAAMRSTLPTCLVVRRNFVFQKAGPSASGSVW